MADSRKNNLRSASRTSIALTIDENGRARAETRIVQEGHENNDRMNVDNESDESESESSSDNSENAMVTSFAQRGSQLKMGRFNSSAPHSQKSSYTSFYSSSSYQDQPSLPELKPRSAKNLVSGIQGRQLGLPPLKSLKEATSMEEDDQASEAETVVDSEDDNAQNELRKIMQDRQKGKNSKPTHHLYSPRKPQQATFSSPTTMTDPDLATPSSQSDAIRCLCAQPPRDDGQMIQW